MPDESVIRIGCLRIAEHFIAGLVQERLKTNKMHLVIMNAYEQFADLLFQGKIHGALLPLPFAMELFKKGLKIKLILFVNRGGGSFLKKTAANIKHIKGFKHKTILTPCLLSVQNMLLHKMFFSAGLNLGKTQDARADVFIEIVPSNIIPEIIDNDSDNDIGGFVASEPYRTLSLETGQYKEICNFKALWKDHPDSVFVLKESIIQEKSEDVQAIVNLFIESGQMIYQGDNNSIAPYGETFFIQQHKIIDTLLPDIVKMFKPEDLKPEYKMLSMIQDYMVDHAGFMTDKKEIKEFFDISFIKN